MKEANAILTGYDKMKIKKVSFKEIFKMLKNLTRERKARFVKEGVFEKYAIMNN